jgi:flagellar basal-body rod modification protein FlgD
MQINALTIGASSGLLGTTAYGATGTTGTGATDGATQLQRTGTTGAYGMSSDDFMTLFLAQLKNQDPTQPMNDKDMLTQLSQFTMISTLTDVEHALAGSQLAQSASLIGKTVTGLASDGSTVSGVVQQLNQSSGVLALIVDGKSLSPDSVTTVTPTPVAPTTSTTGA